MNAVLYLLSLGNKLSLLLILALAATAASADTASLDTAIRKAQTEHLDRSQVWLRLLEYRHPDDWQHDGRGSDVVTPGFFLAKDGSRNPGAELVATLRAIYESPIGDNDKHAQCAFRGRYVWLKRELNLTDEPKVECPKFLAWTSGNSVTSISIVIVTGFLGNPASYYGHVLLKINSSTNESGAQALLDESVNYGALLPKRTNPVSYMVKGIFGGYKGGYSNIRFYFHDHQYGDVQLRDMWEYQLNLDQSDVNLVVGHAWEMLGKANTYFFFHKNCAYRIAQLLEVVDGIDITPGNPFYFIPQVVVQELNHQKYHGAPIIRKVTRYPSRQSQLYSMYRLLDRREKKVVHEVVGDAAVLDASSFESLPDKSKYRVLDTLVDYYQFDKISKQKSSTYDPTYLQVVRKRFQLPPGGATSKNGFASRTPRAPDEVRRPSLIRFGQVYTSTGEYGAAIELRPAYYDALDIASGQSLGAELAMARVNALWSKGHLDITGLTLAAVNSVNDGTTGLPGDKGKSWRLFIGADQENLTCHGCLVSRIAGDMGFTRTIADGWILSGYLGGGVQDTQFDNSRVFTRFSGRLIGYLGRTSLLVGFERRYYGNHFGAESLRAKFSIRYRLSTNLDLRFGIEHQSANRLTLSIGRYW